MILFTYYRSSTSPSLTERMLLKTHQQTTGNWFSRSVVARGAGLSVSVASLLDVVQEATLAVLMGIYAFSNRSCELGLTACGLKGRVNPLKLKHVTGRDAWNHLRRAGKHLAVASAVPVLAILSPSRLLIPGMAKMGFDVPGKTNCLSKIESVVKVGLTLIGLSLAAKKLGVFSFFKKDEGFFAGVPLFEIGVVWTVAMTALTLYCFGPKCVKPGFQRTKVELPKELTNIPKELTNIPEQLLNIPEQLSNIPEQLPNIPEQLPNTGSRGQKRKLARTSVRSKTQGTRVHAQPS